MNELFQPDAAVNGKALRSRRRSAPLSGYQRAVSVQGLLEMSGRFIYIMKTVSSRTATQNGRHMVQ